MAKKQLKRLSRAELLEMLLEQGRAYEELQARTAQLEQQLQDRQLKLASAGSIAEAALALNGVFEAADAACAQYIENVQRRSLDDIQNTSEQDSGVIQGAQTQAQAEEQAQRMLEETKQRCQAYEEQVRAKAESLLSETKQRCRAAEAQAQAKASALLDEAQQQCDKLFSETDKLCTDILYQTQRHGEIGEGHAQKKGNIHFSRGQHATARQDEVKGKNCQPVTSGKHSQYNLQSSMSERHSGAETQ